MDNGGHQDKNVNFVVIEVEIKKYNVDNSHKLTINMICRAFCCIYISSP